MDDNAGNVDGKDGFSRVALWAFLLAVMVPFFWVGGVLDGPLGMAQALPRCLGALGFAVAPHNLASAAFVRLGFGDVLGGGRLWRGALPASAMSHSCDRSRPQDGDPDAVHVVQAPPMLGELAFISAHREARRGVR